MVKIEIFGSGCKKCQTLERNAVEAAEELGIEYEVHKVKDVNEMTERGVMFTPALAIDGEVKSSGRVLPAGKIKELL